VNREQALIVLGVATVAVQLKARLPDATGRLRGEYMTAGLLVTLVVSAIDVVTVAHGRVGVIEDAGIVLTPGELDEFGFTPGLGEPNGGWADRGYRERRHAV
jgi:hypothetical protein